MASPSLDALRTEIDRIDESLHGLVMERARAIDRLVAAKSGAPTASAFRPDREAAVLRRLAERHRGSLPLDAVEGMWRVMMSAFTFAQAPFAVHLDSSDEAMRDSARFHFGFAPPVRPRADPAAVVSAVADAVGDLGLISLRGVAAEPWWERLEPPDAPKAVARLPFLPRPAHPAPEPVLVIAREGAGEGGAVLLSVRWRAGVEPGALRGQGLDILAAAGSSALVASREGAVAADLDGLVEASTPVGRCPPPFALRS